MKSKFIYITVICQLIIVLIISSCAKKTEDIEKEHLKKVVSQLPNLINYKWIVVLPGLGCNGCIQETEAFMRDQSSNEEILFILTKLSSLKILQHKIGVKIENLPNIYIDKDENFELPTDNAVYPILIHLENGQMVNYEFQSPKNNTALVKLTHLASKK